jgi:hypothetical protein
MSSHPDDLTWRVDAMIDRLDQATNDAGMGASVEELLGGDGPYDPDEPEGWYLDSSAHTPDGVVAVMEAGAIHTHGLSERAQDMVMARWLSMIAYGRAPRQGRLVMFSTPRTHDDAYRRLLEAEAEARNPDAAAVLGPVPDYIIFDDSLPEEDR